MKIKQTDLVRVLNDMATRIGQGDSFEGYISYSCMDDNLEVGEFNVSATYRVGNINGQGGMTIIE